MVKCQRITIQIQSLKKLKFSNFLGNCFQVVVAHVQELEFLQLLDVCTNI